jgi:hypothetical protein
MTMQASALKTNTDNGSATRGGAGAQLSRGTSRLQRKSKTHRSALVRFFSIFGLALMMGGLASGATTNNFRPGIRFYCDANYTTADVISTVATNARVYSPVNYDGTSSATGNWQSTNASPTYNNGITCGCNVTGADWQVSAANSWTATRNFGLIFRVPNGCSLSTTVAHCIRVFLLENTTTSGSYVYFDDVVLSQGPRDAGFGVGSSAQFAESRGVRIAGYFAAFESGRGQYFCKHGGARSRNRDGNFSHRL